MWFKYSHFILNCLLQYTCVCVLCEVRDEFQPVISTSLDDVQRTDCSVCHAELCGDAGFYLPT